YSNGRITVRFPWKSDEKDYDPNKAIEELAATAKLTFRPGNSYTNITYADDGSVVYMTPSGDTAETILLDGSNVKSATAQYITTSDNKTEYVVLLEFDDEGKEKFASATEQYLNQTISIWMDDQMISAPTVQNVITDGQATISGTFTAEDATDLANKINAGALPFDLMVESYGTISPSLGAYALQAMGIAAVAALIFICLFMIIMYRVPGFVACIALLGQLAISIMAVSGYFTIFPSFTMTLPGIAGMILSVGMGVDANIITAERIKDELYTGKTLDGCIRTGTKSSFSAIFDGNVTIIIVAIILILVFGPANIFSSLFGVSTTGLIYAFGYTLLVGVIANFIMGVGASRLMLRSVSGLKFLRNRRLYGGKKS
ncbi:MAG: preprotein translocase subunit SecD, partial [Acutalibacteraceae bacterium]